MNNLIKLAFVMIGACSLLSQTNASTKDSSPPKESSPTNDSCSTKDSSPPKDSCSTKDSSPPKHSSPSKDLCSIKDSSPPKDSCSTKDSCSRKPTCPPTNCFDCKNCEEDCSKVAQPCDTICMRYVRIILCEMGIENCKNTQGCYDPSVIVTIWPAANNDESYPEWKRQDIEVRKNCCYNLQGLYNDTLSGIYTNGACVQLFEGPDCTGESLKIDATFTPECLKWIDCKTRLDAGGNAFNDLTSSFKLC